jgi:hypothetical protein
MDAALKSQSRRLWFGLGVSLLIVSVVTLVVLPTVTSVGLLDLEVDVLYMVCGFAGALILLSIYLIWNNHKKSKYEVI